MNIQEIKIILEENDNLIWKFSDNWLNDIQKLCNNDFSVSNIKKIHNNKFESLNKEFNNIFKNKFSNINEDEVKDIVIVEMVKLLQIGKKTFNPIKKATEETFLSKCINNKLLTTSIKINKQISFDNLEHTLSVSDNYNEEINFLNKILEFDGNDSLYLFLKNLSISKNKNLHLFEKDRDWSKLKINSNSVNRNAFYNDLPKGYKSNKNNIIPGYTKYQSLCQTEERKAMFIARDLVTKCKSNFITNKKKNQKFSKIPVLSAIAFDKNGELIKMTYKGEKGEMKHHCEFTLFESVFEKEDWNRIKGGVVYVTLEPCHKRGNYKCESTNELKPKIPCAVRCVESGISKIFIAHHDPDETVKGNGIETLQTGEYKFKKEKGKLVKNGFPDIESAKTLAKYFEDKESCTKLVDSENELVYKIGSPIEVEFFHTDIAIQIMKINSDFLQNKLREAFIEPKYI